MASRQAAHANQLSPVSPSCSWAQHRRGHRNHCSHAHCNCSPGPREDGDRTVPVLHTSRVKLQRRCDLARLMVSEFERRLVWLHVLGSRPPCSPSLEPVDAEQLEECAQIPQPGPSTQCRCGCGTVPRPGSWLGRAWVVHGLGGAVPCLLQGLRNRTRSPGLCPDRSKRPSGCPSERHQARAASSQVPGHPSGGGRWTAVDLKPRHLGPPPQPPPRSPSLSRS